MSKRPHANSVWITKFTTGPYQQVQADDNNGIWISFLPGNRQEGFGIQLTRQQARLLAKRMNECLDATAKK